MKKPLHYILTLPLMFIAPLALSQGWVAEVDVDLNHDLYAYEKIADASLTFSGVTVTGSSGTSRLQFVVRGTGTLSGNMSLSVNGLAWEPYEPELPESTSISAFYSGKYDMPCETGFFKKQGETIHEQMYIWIRVYERMDISSFVQECDEIRFTTNTCSPSFYWEVSDNTTTGFRALESKTTPTISITRQELLAMGFNDPFGRKYVRVTGLFNTTSQLQPIDIYYPGPSALPEPTDPACHNGGDGSIRFDITSGHPQIDDFVVTIFELGQETNPLKQDYFIDGAPIEFHGLSSGRYIAKIENYSSIEVFGNCWTDHEFQLMNPEPVVIASAKITDFNGYQLRCYSDSDARIEVSAAGGTNIYNVFEWTPAISSSAIADNLSNGTYRLKVQDSNRCWSKEYSYDIAAPAILALRLQSTGGMSGYDVSCPDKNDGAIVTEVQGGVSPYAFEWSNGSEEPFLRGIGAGLYKLSVTDINGCSSHESIHLKSPEPISFSIEEINPVTCPGNSTGMIEVQSIRNNLGEVSFLWSSGETESAITNKPSGLYTVTVSDSQGCSASRSHTLKEPLPWSVTIVPASDFNGSWIRCHGESNGQLTAILRDDEGLPAAADSYSWTRNGNLHESEMTLPTLSGLGSGQYRVEATYRTFCKVSAQFMLQEPDAVTAAVSNLSNYNGSPISCAGRQDGSIRASAAGGMGPYDYFWAVGENTPVLTGLGSGTYGVTVTDINGCKGTAQKLLTEPDPLGSNITVLSNFNGQAISCANASDARLKGSATGGTPPFTFEWNSGQASREITGLPSGQYHLSIRDANGCTSTADIDVTDPAPVIASIAETSDYHGYGISCFGSDDGYLLAAGKGGTGQYTYQWTGTLQSGVSISKLSKGEYTVMVTDQNGCSNSATGAISEPAALSLRVAEIQNVACHQGADGEVHLLAEGGVAPHSFSATKDSWQDQPIVKGLKAGSFKIVVQDLNGCFLSTTAEVTEPSPMVIEFTDLEPARCGAAQGRITAMVTGGTGDLNFRWENSHRQVVGEDAGITSLQAGIYTFYASDENACEASRSVGIPSTDGPRSRIAGITPASCSYSMDGKARVEVIEGYGPFAFRWTDGQRTPEASQLRRGSYIVEITDANSCLTVESVMVPAPDTLEVVLIEKTDPACNGQCDGRLTVAATGGNGNYIFNWQEGQGATLADLCGGTYAVNVSDQKQCIAVGSYDLTNPEAISAEIVVNVPPTCPGGCDGQLEITGAGGTGALSYQWDNDQTGPRLKNLCAGMYVSRISDTNNCAISVSGFLQDPEVRVIELGGPIVLCKGQTYTLDGGPWWQSYSWESNTGFRSSNREVQIMDAGVYTLEALDPSGCVGRDSFTLETSDELLTANFLMTSEALTRDTIVVIDISWPLPEHISWTFPDAMKILDDYGEFVFGQFESPGIYDVTLNAILGECHDVLTKTVTIIDRDPSEEEAGRLVQQPFVKNFSLYPNPNEGEFEVIIEYMHVNPMVLTIRNALSQKRVARLEDSGSSYYSKHVDLRPLSAGPYTLELDYGNGTRYIRFIVR